MRPAAEQVADFCDGQGDRVIIDTIQKFGGEVPMAGGAVADPARSVRAVAPLIGHAALPMLVAAASQIRTFSRAAYRCVPRLPGEPAAPRCRASPQAPPNRPVRPKEWWLKRLGPNRCNTEVRASPRAAVRRV